MKKRNLSWLSVMLGFLMFSVLGALTATPAAAATRTWDGGGDDNSWSTAANWVGDVAPVEGDNLVFPSGAAQLSSVNDIGATFGSLTFSGSGYVIDGQVIHLTGGLTDTSTSGTNTIDTLVEIENAQTFSVATGSTLVLGGGLNLDTFTLTVIGGGTIILEESVQGNGHIIKNGDGRLIYLAGNNSGLLTINSGVVRVDGGLQPSDVLDINGGLLAGTGIVGDIIASGGTVSPSELGDPTSTLHANGNVRFNSGANFNVNLAGTEAGETYDLLEVNGDVNLNGGTLTVTANFEVRVGTTFTIIENNGGEPVIGTFAGLPEGAIVTASNGQQFRISYVGGSGNDVTLTRIPGPVITLSINDVSIVEGDSGTRNATFTVRLSAASTSPVTVAVNTSNGTATAGSDYTAVSTTLTFAPGTTVQTVTVPIIGDTAVEPNETFFVNLSNASGAAIGDNQGVGTIINDDSGARISISDVTVTEGNAGTTNATFTVRLSAASTSTVTYDFATVNATAIAGSDYVAVSGSGSFAPGETVQTITVPIIGDTLTELTETFFVDLTNVTNASVADAQGRGTIIDNDGPRPSVSVSNASVTEGNTGTRDMTFTVSLSAASNSSVTITYATSNGTAVAGRDYVATSGTLTIPAGSTTATITVPVIGDLIDEPLETLFLNITSATNATIGDNRGLGTIIDNDAAPSITISNVTVRETNTGTVNAVFVVTLSSASGKTIRVDYTTANGTAVAGADYLARSGTLIFTPGVTTRRIVVPVIGDTLEEAAETFFVNLTNPRNATIADNQGVATIFDNDTECVITGISPRSGPVGTRVTITGAGFTGASNVTFNGVRAGFTVVSDTQIVATVPVGATSGAIRIATACGLVVSPINYTVTNCAAELQLGVRVSLARGAICSSYTGGLYGGTDQYTQAVTIRNIGTTNITGPISLVLDNLTRGVTLNNRTGVTQCAPPLGSPYINFNIGSDNVLRPGERATVTLEFTSDTSNITYTPRILAGPGAR